jgi:hypothetical protein
MLRTCSKSTTPPSFAVGQRSKSSFTLSELRLTRANRPQLTVVRNELEQVLKKIAVILLGYLLLPMLFISVSFAGANKLGQKEGVLRYRSQFSISGIVPLPENNLMIWNWQGKAQLLTNQGKLSAEFKLPGSIKPSQQIEILNVIPDTGGVLMNARIDQKPVVLLASKDGKIIEQWSLPMVFSIVSDQGNRKAFTEDGVFTLSEKGKADREKFFIGDKTAKNENFPNTIKVYVDKKVICADGDLSKLNQRPIICKKLVGDAHEFQIVGTLADPSACDESILAWGVGKKEHSLAVYSSETGNKVSEKVFNKGAYPTIACDSQTNKLLIGNNGIEIYAMPNLQKIWSYPVKKGKYVSNLALLEKFIAFEEEIAGEVDHVESDIVLVPRP